MYIIISFCVIIVSILTTIRNVCRAVSGYLEMKRISEIPYYGIRIKNEYYKKGRVVGCILILLFYFFVLYSLKSSYQFGIIYSIMFTVVIVTTVIDIVVIIIMGLFGKEGYLSYDGIATIDGIYKKGKYRFVVEKEQTVTDGKTFITVYGDKNDPYRFQIMEEEEKAIKMVESLS